MTRRILAVTLLGCLALTGGPALAAEDGAISTASAAAPPQTVSDQIADYLATSPVTLPKDDAPGVISRDDPDRQMHGEVSVAVGTQGYRNLYARGDIPIGKTGQLSIAVQDSRGRGFYGPINGQSLGLGFSLGEAASSGLRDRCLDRTFAPGGYERSDYECRRARRASPLL